MNNSQMTSDRRHRFDNVVLSRPLGELTTTRPLSNEQRWAQRKPAYDALRNKERKQA